MSSQNEKPECEAYGKLWDASAPECTSCFVSSKCRQLTEQRKSGGLPAPEEPPEPAEDAKLSPLEHLIQSLEGKYERSDDDRDEAVGHYFRDKGQVVALVVVSKESGRVKLETPSKHRILEALETVEEAEEALAYLLG